MKRIHICLSFIITFIIPSFLIAQIDANSVLGIPQTLNTVEMNGITGATEGSMVYNVQQKGIFIFDGTNWVSTSNSNWLINGNNGTTTADFLGTIDDIRMQIRSNNLPILEFGRRQTLGLTQAFPDYTDNDQPLVHVNGNGNIAALQFAAAGADFYKPMFFTTANGSFRLKGSSGGTDLFEIGSGGPTNDGRLEFIIGDDGAEPIIFKRYDFRNGQFHKELFRVQGSSNSADARTRFGININTAEVPVDTGYDDSQAAFNIANSTLQIEGSISKSIITTTGNLTLTEDHHTIVLGGNHTITLPPANSCRGRIYVVKNPNTNATNISNYTNLNSVNNINTINNNSVLWLQSDGTRWQQINNISTVNSGNVTANESLRIIRGNVNNNGSTAQGTGFTVVRTATGRHTITFNTAFGGVPSFTANVLEVNGSDDNYVSILSISATQIRINIFDGNSSSFEDSQFSFIAIGPQ